jgi:hypothetical protein
MGIEPTSEAWEASILPLYDARSSTKLAKHLPARKHQGTRVVPLPSPPRTLSSQQLSMTVTAHQVIVHQARGLHERITDGRPNEAEPSLQQILAQGDRKRGFCRYLFVRFPTVLDWFAPYKIPHVRVKAPVLFLDAQKRAGICDCRLNFQPVPDDSGIAQQRLHLLAVEERHFCGIKFA